MANREVTEELETPGRAGGVGELSVCLSALRRTEGLPAWHALLRGGSGDSPEGTAQTPDWPSERERARDLKRKQLPALRFIFHRQRFLEISLVNRQEWLVTNTHGSLCSPNTWKSLLCPPCLLSATLSRPSAPLVSEEVNVSLDSTSKRQILKE